MGTRIARLTVPLAIGSIVFVGASGAFGVSDGNYEQVRQGCHDQTLDNQYEHTDPEGVNGESCHNATARLDDGSGHTYVKAGTLATQEDQYVDTGELTVDLGPGAAFRGTIGPDGPDGGPIEGSDLDPTTGLHLYFGADDNLNGGEHDGSDLVGPSPSDGGGIALDVDPDAAQTWGEAAANGDSSYLLRNLFPGVAFGTGACADGICFAAATSERTAYQGGSNHTRNVADYDGKEWDPDTCSGEDDDNMSCDDPATAGNDGEDITYWQAKEGNVVVQPGVAVFEDPDPQGSPLGFPSYPTPGYYVGSCGVIADGAWATPSPC